MNSYFSNNAVMCDPSGTILGKLTRIRLHRSHLGPIWAYPYGFAQKSPYRTHIAISLFSFPLEKAVSSSKTHAFISSFYCNVLQVL